MIRTFGRYGFNKSHSTAYALLAFQTAYLKVHFPVFYFTSLLSGELNDTDKICQYVCDARDAGIEVKSPDVNQSGALFEVEADQIRYALAAVKNVGESAALSIVEERLENGAFSSLHDFTSRVDLRLVNRRVMESLIKCGAMDSFEESRRTLFENIESALNYGGSVQGDKLRGQSSLFEELGQEQSTDDFYHLQHFDEWGEAELSEYEREVLGFYFKAHPILKYSAMVERFGAAKIGELKEIPGESKVSIFGILSSLKVITTRDNKEMAFVSLEDQTGTVEVVVFPSVYEKCNQYLKEKKVVVITGKINGDKVLADRFLYPEEVEKESFTGLHILIDKSVHEDKLMRLRDIFIQHRGKCSVFIHTPELEGTGRSIKASSFLLVDPKEDLLLQLKEENLVQKAWIA
jgi:DNA polymerase-3 subunit alpha